MRITLSTDEAINIKVKLELILMDVTPDEHNEVLKALIEKIDKELKKPTSVNKQVAAKKATVIRQERVKEKIRNAINLLHLEDKKINVNSISRESGVAYNTVKKYSYLIY